MKTQYQILLTVFSMFFLAGCGGSSSDSPKDSGGNAYDVNELGYNPTSRWPQNGNYSYNFDYTYNGSNCQINKIFTSQAAYCMGLQDQKLNDSCALSLRKDSYQQECGNDFQEINFSRNFERSGFDDRLQKNCVTSRSWSLNFRNENHYCSFLKDESLHNNCHWDARQDEYILRQCSGAFSQEPPIVAPPISSPNPPVNSPNPPQNPAPAPPISEPRIVQELKNSGIEVEINWTAIRDSRRYGRSPISVEDQLNIFWQELERNKNNILMRQNAISLIEVTSYTTYHKNNKSLSLDFETSPNTLSIYFALLDALFDYSEELGIEFDFIHSGYSPDKHPYLPLVSMIEALDKNIRDLEPMKGVFTSVTTNSYSGYYSKSGRLTLKSDVIATELARYIQILKPVAPIYGWATKNRVKIDIDFNADKDMQKVATIFNSLKTALPSLQNLATANMLEEIRIYLLPDNEIKYWNSSKNISISTSGVSMWAELPQFLNLLGDVAAKSLELKMPITISSGAVDNGLAKSVGTLKNLWLLIKAKASKIKDLRLGYSSSYIGSALTIGSETSEKDTQKIIERI